MTISSISSFVTFFCLLLCPLLAEGKTIYQPASIEEMEQLSMQINGLSDSKIVSEIANSLANPNIETYNRTLLLFRAIRVRRILESRPVLEGFLSGLDDSDHTSARKLDPSAGYRQEAEACLLNFDMEQSCYDRVSSRVACILSLAKDRAEKGQPVTAEAILLKDIAGSATQDLLEVIDHSTDSIKLEMALSALESSTDEQIEDQILTRMGDFGQRDKRFYIKAMGVLARIGGEASLGYIDSVSNSQEQDIAVASRECLFIMSRINRNSEIRDIAHERNSQPSPSSQNE